MVLFFSDTILLAQDIPHFHVISEIDIDGTSNLRLVFMIKTGFLGTLSVNT